MRQLVCSMFITNNHGLFHLWWKEDLVKHQKVSKFYDHDCSYITTYTSGDNLPPLRDWRMYPAIECYWKSVYQYNLYRGLFWFTPGTGHIGKPALFRLYLHSLGLWFTYGSAVNWISANVSCQVPSHFE